MMKSHIVRQDVAYQAYPHWDIKSPPLPHRSHLFRLEPIGIGTAEVESLTSYVTRLSEAHCVSSQLLLCKEIYPSTGKRYSHYSGSLGFSASQINGFGKIAETTITALEQLTYRDNLRYMTLLTWGNIFSSVGLLRPQRAWCAVCHDERLKEGKPLYEQLIWTFEDISVCPWHREQLRETCQHYKHSLPVLAAFSYPGYCSRCGRWLGSSNLNVKGKCSGPLLVSKAEIARQVSTTYSISEFLSGALTLSEPPPHDRFIANLTNLIEQTASGRINYFSTVVGLWSGTVRRLLAGTTKLRLSVLLQICLRLNISPFNLLSNADNLAVPENRLAMLGERTTRPDKPISWEDIGKKLSRALREHPPPSLESVARRMGYYPIRLSNNFPKQCARIVSRYREYRRSKHPEPKKINSALRAALREQPPPSLQKVLRRLGCQSTGYYFYYDYPDLCFAIAERFKNHRNKPFNIEIERERLQAALVEQPPPPFSEVAKRLSHNREFVRRKFPELSKAIRLRYISYRDASRKLKAEQLRDEIRVAINQITASGLYVSEARVREHVKNACPD
jgi:hypothetical protein